MGLAALRHVGSSQTRDRTCVSCIARWTLIHCTTREGLQSCFCCGREHTHIISLGIRMWELRGRGGGARDCAYQTQEEENNLGGMDRSGWRGCLSLGPQVLLALSSANLRRSSQEFSDWLHASTNHKVSKTLMVSSPLQIC